MLLKIPFFHYTSLIVFLIIAVIVLATTLLPFIPSEQWYIRVLDYPRLQTFIIAVIALGWYLVFYFWKGVPGYIIVGFLLIAMVIQAYKAFPYTPLSSKQVQWATPAVDDNTAISFFISNVQQKNENYQLVIDRVKAYDPDIVITTESGETWGKHLAVLKKDYPGHVEIPLNNTYGMHLFSKLPLQETDIRYLIAKDIPSIKTKVRLRSNEWIQLFIVHPRPPFPTEDEDTKERDAELVMVGKEARKTDGGVIVAGDFNDVAWSATTTLFQEVSGLLDPRRGRGFFNTFHAKWPIFRWPLDHIFHSNHFQLINIERAEKVGSDHFPMYVKLKYVPEQQEEQPEVEKDDDTDEKAEKTIEEGKEK